MATCEELFDEYCESLRKAFDAMGKAVLRMGDEIDLASIRLAVDEPPNRTERRQQASPRYVKAAAHGADGQRALVHKAWRGE